MNRQDILQSMMKDPLMKPEYRERAVGWLKNVDIMPLNGGVAFFNGNKVHLEVEGGANKIAFIRSLIPATVKALGKYGHLIAIIPADNEKIIAVTKWLGFHFTREYKGNVELRKEK